MSEAEVSVNKRPHLVSVAKMQDLSRKDFKSFEKVRCDDKEFQKIVCSKVWSPIIYKGEHRVASDFVSADYIALDFDQGTTLEEMRERILEWDCWAIIGTTKSHQKEKRSSGGEVQLPCDRFRVIFRMHQSCTDAAQYAYNLKSWVQKSTMDKGVKDAARYFYPCKEIYFLHQGECMDWLVLPKGYEKALFKRLPELDVKRYQAEKTVPNWVMHVVEQGVEIGNRHNMVYAIGINLLQIGFSVDEIFSFVCMGPLAAIGEKDVRRCIENGKLRLGQEGFIARSSREH